MVITLFSFFIIKWMLWPKDESREIENVPNEDKRMVKQPLNRIEKKTIILISLLIVGWITESIHGYDIAFITMVGAILSMMPNYGIISWKQGMKSVSWNLIVFVAAATALGKVLVDTGVVKWIEKEMLQCPAFVYRCTRMAHCIDYLACNRVQVIYILHHIPHVQSSLFQVYYYLVKQ